MLFERKLRFSALFLGLMSTQAPAATSIQTNDYFVDDDAVAGQAGTSWGRAFKHLQDALLVAGDGAVIHIAGGVYEPDRSHAHPEWLGDRERSFHLPQSVQLLGGFAGVLSADPDDRDPALYPTVLSGDLLGNDGSLLDVSSVDEFDPLRVDNTLVVISVYKERVGLPVDVNLDGLTVQSGFHPRDPIAGLSGEGAGLLCNSGGGVTVTLRDVLVRGNYAGASGGGILNKGGAVHLRETTIIGNASRFGAGFASLPGRDRSVSGLDAFRCVFESNALVSGDAGELVMGAAFASSGVTGVAVANVSECLFLRNSAVTSGGLGSGCLYFGARTQARVESSTFKGNSADSVLGGGTLYCASNSLTLNFINNICWEVSPTENHMVYPAGGIVRVGFNNIQASDSNFPPLLMDARGNFEGDPDFIDGMGRIGGASACIDAGINRFADSEVDFDGGLRILDDAFSSASGFGGPSDTHTTGTPGLRPIVDVGAFEYFRDCNGNGVLDTEDVSTGGSPDLNLNGIPDECESSCAEFGRVRTLTGRDTITLATNVDSPDHEVGYVYAHAVDDGGEAIAFDHLIGQQVLVDGIESFQYAVNAVDFRSALEGGEWTDLDGDGNLDLNGEEYEMAPNEVLVPRFFGQVDGVSESFVSELVLIGLSGGRAFQTTVGFTVYNDNEEAFSTQHTFDCWEKVRLSQISGVFTASFLGQFTSHDASEVLGAPELESGWFRMKGEMANSSSGQVADPAVYGVLIEGTGATAAVDLPFELGGRAGHLLPLHIQGDNEEWSGENTVDEGFSASRRTPGSLLLYPEFDNRDGIFSVLSLTNRSQEDVSVKFVYVGRLK
jgi:hypothetical protein